ncbi:MAG: hypothetical protein JWM27_4248 [Gemmatimonadetes bacterium]|nr:hypothetical protein [Gemmatimonadota bacterium]
MPRIKLDPDDLFVDSFDLTPGGHASTVAGADSLVATVAVLTVFTNAETNDQICFCMTWVAEDCIGPTAGCSTSDVGAV